MYISAAFNAEKHICCLLRVAFVAMGRRGVRRGNSSRGDRAEHVSRLCSYWLRHGLDELRDRKIEVTRYGEIRVSDLLGLPQFKKLDATMRDIAALERVQIVNGLIRCRQGVSDLLVSDAAYEELGVDEVPVLAYHVTRFKRSKGILQTGVQPASQLKKYGGRPHAYFHPSQATACSYIARKTGRLTMLCVQLRAAAQAGCTVLRTTQGCLLVPEPGVPARFVAEVKIAPGFPIPSTSQLVKDAPGVSHESALQVGTDVSDKRSGPTAETFVRDSRAAAKGSVRATFHGGDVNATGADRWVGGGASRHGWQEAGANAAMTASHGSGWQGWTDVADKRSGPTAETFVRDHLAAAKGSVRPFFHGGDVNATGADRWVDSGAVANSERSASNGSASPPLAGVADEPTGSTADTFVRDGGVGVLCPPKIRDTRFDESVRKRKIRCDGGCGGIFGQKVTFEGDYQHKCPSAEKIKYKTEGIAEMKRCYEAGTWNATWLCTTCEKEKFETEEGITTSLEDFREATGRDVARARELNRKKRRTREGTMTKKIARCLKEK